MFRQVAAQHPGEVHQHREQRHGQHACDDPRRDQEVEGIDCVRLERVDLLGDAHGTKFRPDACAHTAREMRRAHMQECIESFRSIAAGDHPAYVTHTEQAEMYATYFERELGILGVARG